MGETQLDKVGTCTIDGVEYTMVRTEFARAWNKRYAPEPQWPEGAPPMLSSQQITWHLGGFKSREGIPGTSEYGQNTDGRFPFRLQPGPNVKALAQLLQSGDTPTCGAEALGYMWVGAGQRVYRIDPSDDTILESKDFGSGVTVMDCLEWEDGYLYITTDADDQSLWRCTAIGTPDTWVQSDASTKAYKIAKTNDTMFRVSKTGELRKVGTGLSPIQSSDWADSIQMGNKTDPPNSLQPLEDTVICGKPDGIFAVDANGFGRQIITRMIPYADNGLGMLPFEPFMFIPHSRGLIRYSPGFATDVGLERELLNESPVKGTFTAMASDGLWIYGVIPIGSDIYVLAGREAKENEASFGPIIWDTLIFLESVACSWIAFSMLWSDPMLLLGVDNAVYKVPLEAGMSMPKEFLSTGKRYSPKYDFGDEKPKDFPKFDIAGQNLSGDRKWTITYSIDSGSFLAIDINGDTMEITDDEPQTFLLPASATGRTIQFLFEYSDVAGDATEHGDIVHFEPYSVPQSSKVPIITVQLQLAEGLYRDRGKETRSVDDQLAALQTLAEAPGSVSSTGPWGASVRVSVRSVELVEMLQTASNEPEHLVSIVLQERES